MTDLLAARTQMAISLGFHIVFAAIGIAMPVLMAAAEWRWLTKGDREALNLAQRWSKGTAILFAVGAVSGTVLSFELGLLWPKFMERAGPHIGPLFALEGFAFFTEAIFLGIYLYAWSRISPRAHFVSGLVVAASGVASAFFVITVNAWMNGPTGLARNRPYAIGRLRRHRISRRRNSCLAAAWQSAQPVSSAGLDDRLGGGGDSGALAAVERGPDRSSRGSPPACQARRHGGAVYYGGWSRFCPRWHC